jgi:NAD(P)-dependent dehydrogenase (short-subunit alcohol dehydrogenase family)
LKTILGSQNKTKFISLAVDVSDLEISKRAAAELIERKEEFGGSLKYVCLNAGLLTNELKRTAQGYELMLAASLFGHHVLVTEWLKGGLIADNATIVISGSEGAVNVFPATMMGYNLPDYHQLAKGRGQGLKETLVDLSKNTVNADKFVQEPQYGFAKSYVAWWAAAMARKYPSQTFLTVSPGMTTGTEIINMGSAPIYMVIMLYIMSWIGPYIGMAHNVSTGAKRYVDGLLTVKHGDSGSFWASPPRWMSGKLTKQNVPHIQDQVLQNTAYEALVEMTGTGL